MKYKNITQPFSLYLKSQQVSQNTLRNYLSDINHFLGWLDNYEFNLGSDEPNIIAQKMSKATFKKYKQFLRKNSISVVTVNRRLSSLRQLSAFFVSQGWTENDQAKKITNITTKKEMDLSSQLITKFAKSLTKEEKSSSTIRNYLSDVRNYLDYLEI